MAINKQEILFNDGKDLFNVVIKPAYEEWNKIRQTQSPNTNLYLSLSVLLIIQMSHLFDDSAEHKWNFPFKKITSRGCTAKQKERLRHICNVFKHSESKDKLKIRDVSIVLEEEVPPYGVPFEPAVSKLNIKVSFNGVGIEANSLIEDVYGYINEAYSSE